MKRTLKLTLSSLMLLSIILSGCGGNNTNQDASTPNQSTDNSTSTAKDEPKESGEVIKLKFWGGTPEENGPKAVVDLWNKNNPDIQVEYVRYVNDDQGNVKLETALLSSTDAPDVFVTYNDAQLDRRVKAGMTESLDDLIKSSGFDVEGIIGMDNITKTDGKIYNLPGTKDIRFFAINKTMLDGIGEKIPEAGWTWDQYAELAKKLTKDGHYGSYFFPTWEPPSYDVLASAQPEDTYYAADGTSNFNHEAFRKGLELQKSLLDAKVLMPYAEAVANKVQGQDELLNGRTASVYTATFFFRYIKDDAAYPNRDYQIAFAPMPQWEAGDNVNSAKYSDLISINAKSRNKEAAMKFLSWYLTEGNMEMVPSGRIPSSNKADIAKIAELIMADKSQYYDVDSFKKLLENQYTHIKVTKTDGMIGIRQALMEESEKYFMDAQDLDTTVEMIKKRADEAIASENK